MAGQMFVKNTTIGDSVRPKIIAEIGINHNGSLADAKLLSEQAICAGADFVKTQLHIPHEEMSKQAKSIIPSHCEQSIYEIIDKCSLSLDEEYSLKTHIEALGGTYLSTPFSVKAAHVLGSDFKVDAFKIGSGECTNLEVLKAVADYKKPIILSTGMTSLSDVIAAVDMLKERDVKDLILMHTTNLYPTPHNLVRLGGITELQSIVGNSSVGLSDHTTSNLACLGAVALGAVLLERHFTDTKERSGPDIVNSMTPKELRELRRDSEFMFQMRGGSKARHIAEEDDTRAFAYATVVSTQSIRKGDLLTPTNISVQRPGIGSFLSRDLHRLYGNPVLRDLEIGEHIMSADVCLEY